MAVTLGICPSCGKMRIVKGRHMYPESTALCPGWPKGAVVVPFKREKVNR